MKNSAEIENLDRAIEFATNKFKEVNVDNHFLSVLKVLQEEFRVSDPELLIAAVLHDTLEDTNTTYEELEENFSKPVADLVEEVSHPKNYNYEQKLEFYKKLETVSERAKILKLADFVDNLREEIQKRKKSPNTPYHGLYIQLIRKLLEKYPDSQAKNAVLDLTKELELFVTK
jgi:(p)ppGpp synthase/HD superfamily hydrolase